MIAARFRVLPRILHRHPSPRRRSWVSLLRCISYLCPGDKTGGSRWNICKHTKKSTGRLLMHSTLQTLLSVIFSTGLSLSVRRSPPGDTGTTLDQTSAGPLISTPLLLPQSTLELPVPISGPLRTLKIADILPRPRLAFRHIQTSRAQLKITLYRLSNLASRTG